MYFISNVKNDGDNKNTDNNNNTKPSDIRSRGPELPSTCLLSFGAHGLDDDQSELDQSASLCSGFFYTTDQHTAQDNDNNNNNSNNKNSSHNVMVMMMMMMMMITMTIDDDYENEQ